jgi:hypothetical protein
MWIAHDELEVFMLYKSKIQMCGEWMWNKVKDVIMRNKK